MKRVMIIAMAIALVGFTCNAEEIKWMSWNDGYKMAKKQKKPMVVFVYTKWCNQSKRMLEKSFTNEEVENLINENYIPIKFDLETKEKLKFKKMEYEALFLLSEISQNPIQGIQPADWFKY